MNTVADKSASADSPGLRHLRELYFELGQALSQHERLAEAIPAFEQALKEEGANPGGDVVLFNLGQTQERAGKPESAFQSYLEAIAVAPQRVAEILPGVHKLLNPDLAMKEGEWLQNQWEPGIKKSDLAPGLRAELARFIGRVSLQRGEYTRAEKLFREALDASPDDPLALEGLGETLWHTGQIPDALQSLTRARDIAEHGEHKDRVAIIDAKLAQALVAAGQYQVALDLITKSLDGGDRFTNQLLLSRVQCYLGLAEWDKALEAAQVAQARTPVSTGTRILSCQALIALGRCSDAVKVIDEALQYDLQNPDLLLYKAEALLEGQIDEDQARRLLTRYTDRAGSAAVTPEKLPAALSARSADGNAQYFLAELYCALGRDDEALKAVNKALEIGLLGEGDYREAPAQLLKAELLEKRGERQQAAEFFYEAGRRYYWRNEYDKAQQQLRRSIALNETRPATYWYLAEVLRLLSYQATLAKEQQKTTIEESVTTWDQSTEYGLPDRDTFWAYVTRALICEQRANLQATSLGQQRSWWWEGAAFVERALLLSETYASSWAFLGRYHRALGNQASALQATEKGWQLDPKDRTVQEERAAILADVGKFEEAAKAIDQRREAEANTWADGVKAYILAGQREYRQALELIGPIDETKLDVWTLDLRARCYRMLGERERAEEDYKTNWSHYDSANFSDQISFGVSAYYVGEIQQAIKIFADYLKTDDDLTGYWYLGACHLTQKNLKEGEENLLRSVAISKNTRELSDFLEEELPSLEAASKEWPHHAQVIGILQRIREQISTRSAALQVSESPENNLKNVLEQPARADKSDGWRQIAVQAGLGRLYNEIGKHEAAGIAYRELARFPAGFPEAAIGLRNVATGFEAKGDGLLTSGDPDSAIRQFSSGLDFLADDMPIGLAEKASLHSRLGLAHLLATDSGMAWPEFRQALELNRKLENEHPGLVLGETCRHLLSDPRQYWALDDEWNSRAREVKDSESLKSDLAAARESLREFLVDWLEKRPPDNQEFRIPVVTPIVMEIGSGMIAEDTGKNWALWNFILDMRGRLEKEIGVVVPGVRVRGNDALSSNEYALLLDENWVVGGHTNLEMRYCPAASGVLQALAIPSEALVSVPNPLTGQPGCWSPREYWQLITNHNVELWEEPLVFVVRHLEAMLRRNLADFLGVQEVETLLENWGITESDAVLIQRILPDDAARLRFARLLRTLVREQVPITSWKEILDSAQASGLGNLASAVRAARVRLKKELPGNAPGVRRFELPVEWDAALNSWLKYRDGTIQFTPPGEMVHRFLLMLGELLQSDEANAALVVDNPEVRPYLWQLVEWRFPHLTVLSTEELVLQATSASRAM